MVNSILSANYFMTIYGNLFRWLWFHLEVFRENFFFFSYLQFLASEDFVDRLGLLKCSKDLQNFRNLEKMFLVKKFETDWFKWKPFWLKCLPVRFLLPRISTFKFFRWLVNCLTVSTALPLSGLSICIAVVISVSGNC